MVMTGISSQEPEDIADYLAPLLSHALQQIPPSQHASTPVYLYATAGMRLLPEDEQQAILSAACSAIRNDYPFTVGQSSTAGPCGENIRVISGEEEGMWGWVAVNYLMDGFGHSAARSSPASPPGSLLPLEPLAEPPPDSSKDSVTPVDVSHHLPTFGFLDMGGASTQLAFSPTPNELSRSSYPEDELGRVKLRLLSGEDVEWPVFVASWLGFGTNRARDRYVEQLLERWRAAHPEHGTMDLTEPVPDPCLPRDLRIPSEAPDVHPDFVGTGAFATCLEDLRPLLEHSRPCPSDHCLFAGRPTPYIDFERQDQRGFIGVSEYWYTAQQVLGLGGIWDWGEWEKGMGEFCQRDWTGIEAQVEEDKGWRGAQVSKLRPVCRSAGIDDLQVELSRLQMQCFKGAWISNVLHEGIGIPRLVDAGGEDTLTGGELGDTNAEAERRAREKGLFEDKPKKHHFQSMDEVDETAISWTLGKMVIEASKAVQPRSHALEVAWLDRIHLHHLENRLHDYGIQAVWAYGFIAFVFAACLFAQLRRKFRLFGYSSSYKRNRKPSISQGPPISPTSGSWCWPLRSSSESSSGYSSLEEGIDLTPTKPSRPTLGRLRVWTYRLNSLLRRKMPSLPFHHAEPRSRTMRHASMPLTSSYRNNTPEVYHSQPPSPRANSFFVPATTAVSNTTSLGVPSSRPSSSASASEGRPSSSANSTSPPRAKAARPFRPRQPSAGPTSTNGSNGLSSDRGWNDPPVSMFGQSYGDVGTPGSGGGLAPNGISGQGTGFEAPISRNSSRVNLSEMGLAQRSASRAGTPMDH